MRLIDADVLKEMLIKERDSIPLSKTERYSFGVGLPNPLGMAMRGGVNKAFRCMENTPTIDPESLRVQGQWHIFKDEEFLVAECPNCGMVVEATQAAWWDYCPNCGACMKGAGEDADS